MQNPSPIHPSSSSMKAWLPTLPWLVGIGFIFWFGALSTFNLSIDQEFAIFREDERVWISQGRWAIFFLTQYIYTQPVIGYFPHVVFVVLSALSYLLLVDAFGISPQRRNWVLLGAALFMAHPVWVFMTEFYTNLVPTALGMISCSLALWCFAYGGHDRGHDRGHGPLLRGGMAFAQVGLVFLALGNYQAFVLVMAVLYMAYLANAYSLGRLSLGQLWRTGLLALGYLVAALVLHQLFLKLLYRLYDVAPSYVGSLINITALAENPYAVFISVLKGATATYAGNAQLYSSSLFFVGLSVLLGICVFSYKALQQRRLVMSALLLFLLLFTPFLLHVAAGGFWHMPLRASLALPFVVAFLTLYALLNVQQRWLHGLIVAVLVVSNVQLLHLQARYSSAKQLTLEYDRYIANQLADRITRAIPNYSFAHSYPFSVQGGLRYHSPYRGVDTTTITGSFFWWDNGNADRITTFMRIIGLHGLTPVSVAQQEALAPIYATMPLWPAQDSVQVHEGVIMVKFAE